MLRLLSPGETIRSVPIRYYVYISKTKVDSLYDQIPRKQLKHLARKLTIDLKIIKAEFGTEEREESLVAKTQIVESYLDHEGVVADVDAAGKDDEVEFFAGGFHSPGAPEEAATDSSISAGERTKPCSCWAARGGTW